MRTLRIALIALLTLTAGVGGAALAEAPSVKERQVGGVYFVEGSFEVAAPAEAAWKVLTDYAEMARFVSSLRSSEVKQRRDGVVLVAQRAEAKAWVFSRELNVLLEVKESPRTTLHFRDVSKQDFTLYEGSWTVTPTDDGSVRIDYRLRALPKAAVPGFLGHDAFRQTAQRLLQEVQHEIGRQSQAVHEQVQAGVGR